MNDINKYNECYLPSWGRQERGYIIVHRMYYDISPLPWLSHYEWLVRIQRWLCRRCEPTSGLCADHDPDIYLHLGLNMADH